MLYHGFIGTIADNAIEIGWVLCFSLLADKSVVERITTMFGLNDAFWIILSSTYYIKVRMNPIYEIDIILLQSTGKKY